MTNKYKLDVSPAINDDCCYGYYSRGHDHDETEFRESVSYYTGEPVTEYDRCNIVRVWWRAVPDVSGEFNCLYHEAKPNSRGAFPVMILENQA
ncbi:MAG: hypothetical protein WA154_10980 [Moraxellaceae bacterium]